MQLGTRRTRVGPCGKRRHSLPGRSAHFNAWPHNNPPHTSTARTHTSTQTHRHTTQPQPHPHTAHTAPNTHVPLAHTRYSWAQGELVLASAGSDGTVYLWDVQRGREMVAFDLDILVFHICLHPRRRWVCVCVGGWVCACVWCVGCWMCGRKGMCAPRW